VELLDLGLGGWSESAGGSMPWFPWKPASPRPGRSIRGRPTREEGRWGTLGQGICILWKECIC